MTLIKSYECGNDGHTLLDRYISTTMTRKTTVAIPEYTETTINAFCISLQSAIVKKNKWFEFELKVQYNKYKSKFKIIKMLELFRKNL